MPERKLVRKVPSEKAQGKDSWVEFKSLTYGERSLLREEAEKHTEDETGEWARSQERRLFTEHLVGWNWVGENGEPLPLPSEDPDVIQSFTDDEFAFINSLFEVSNNGKK